MLNSYYAIVSEIAAEMVSAMRYRMGECGDYRPLFVYVSQVDGGWTIGHEGQHIGYWMASEPITCAEDYQSIPRKLARILRNAPLFATANA